MIPVPGLMNYSTRNKISRPNDQRDRESLDRPSEPQLYLREHSVAAPGACASCCSSMNFDDRHDIDSAGLRIQLDESTLHGEPHRARPLSSIAPEGELGSPQRRDP